MEPLLFSKTQINWNLNPEVMKSHTIVEYSKVELQQSVMLSYPKQLWFKYILYNCIYHN